MADLSLPIIGTIPACMRSRGTEKVACGEQPPNKALKLTKPAKERAPRHSAVQHRAPCRSARSSLMWASQLNAVFDRLPQGHGLTVDGLRSRGARYALRSMPGKWRG